MSKREQLYLPAKELRVQTSPDGSRTISGFAIVYNSPSQDLGGFTEIVAPGAVTESLRNSPDILCLRDHAVSLLMGRTTSKTLTLTDDAIGLRFSCRLPDTTQASDLATSIDRGDLSGVSFGFVTEEDKWVADEQGNVVRTLLKITLYEISPCSFPAYSASSVRSCPPELRSRIRSKNEDDEEDSECGCNCSECLAGDHEDCTSDDGLCNFDGDDYDDGDRSNRKLTWSERTLLRIEVARRK